MRSQSDRKAPLARRSFQLARQNNDEFQNNFSKNGDWDGNGAFYEKHDAPTFGGKGRVRHASFEKSNSKRKEVALNEEWN